MIKKKNKITYPAMLVLGELSLVHCVGTAGIPVITGSEGHKTPAAYSKYSKKHIIFSDYESDEFIEELCDLGKSMDEKMVIVTYDDRVILQISAHREELSEYFLFTLPDHSMVEKLLDKLMFCDLCEEMDLPAPASVKVSNAAELKAARKKLKAPYLIKPAYRHLWFHEDFTNVVGNYQKAYKCDTFEELEQLYSKIAQIHPDVVVQDYIIGDDSSMYDLNFYVSEENQIENYVNAQKMRVYPPTAGWGSYVRTVHNDEIYALCLLIIKKLKLKGLINIQFKQDKRSGEYKLIEIHTRTSIFDFLGAKAGQNVPATYYAQLTGRKEFKAKEKDYRDEVKYINVGRDVRLFLRYGKDYNIPLGTWAKTYLQASLFDGILLKDLYPTLRRFV